jgi:hypothetical protein
MKMIGNTDKKDKKTDVAWIDTDAAFKPHTIVIYFFKYLFLFIWNFVKSFIALFYIKKKSIKNEVVLLTGSGGYLGKKLYAVTSRIHLLISYFSV